MKKYIFIIIYHIIICLHAQDTRIKILNKQIFDLQTYVQEFHCFKADSIFEIIRPSLLLLDDEKQALAYSLIIESCITEFNFKKFNEFHDELKSKKLLYNKLSPITKINFNNAYAKYLVDVKDFEKADSVFNWMELEYDKIKPDYPTYMNIQTHKSRYLNRIRDKEKEKILLDSLLNNIDTSNIENKLATANLYFRLNNYYHDLSDRNNQLPFCHKSLEYFEKYLGMLHPKTIYTKIFYNRILNEVNNINTKEINNLDSLFTNLKLNTNKEYSQYYYYSALNLNLLCLSFNKVIDCKHLLLELDTIYNKANINYVNDIIIGVWENLAQAATHEGNYTSAKNYAIKTLKVEFPNSENLANLSPFLLHILILNENFNNKLPSEQKNKNLAELLKCYLESSKNTNKNTYSYSEPKTKLVKRNNLFKEELILQYIYSELAKENNNYAGDFLNYLLYHDYLLEKVLESNQQMALRRDSSFNSFLSIYNKEKVKLLAYINRGPSFDNSIYSSQLEILEKSYNEFLRKDLYLEKKFNWQFIKNNLDKKSVALYITHIKPGPNSQRRIYSGILINSELENPQYVEFYNQQEVSNFFKENNPSESKIYLHNTFGIADSTAIKVYQKLEKFLKGKKKIYLQSTGLFSQINFSELPINNFSTFADKYEIIQKSSLTNIIKNTSKTIKNNNIWLIANQIYNNFSTDTLSFHLRAGHVIDSIPNLIYSQIEIDRISNILNKSKSTKRIDKDLNLTKNEFLDKIKNNFYEIIHIAVHGFSLGNPENKEMSSFYSKFDLHDIYNKCGILFKGDSFATSACTGNDFMNLNLFNSELVVLSACQTAQSQIINHETFYSLQRALKVAGARNVLTSLWQVPDQSTSELMTLFYKNWIIKKMPINKSLASAQSKIRKKYPDPIHWAGWILVE